MSEKWIHTTTSLLGGVGVGALLMYLMDPDKGQDRRQYIAAKAGNAAAATGETLGSALHSLADRANDLSQAVADHATSAASHAKSATASLASEVATRARDLGDSVLSHGARGYKSAKKTASDAADHAGKTVRSHLSHLLPHREEEGMGATGITLTAVAALALGAGAMYLLDPNQGWRRRAYLHRQAARAASTTGHAIGSATRAVGQYASHMTGMGGMSDTVGDARRAQEANRPRPVASATMPRNP